MDLLPPQPDSRPNPDPTVLTTEQLEHLNTLPHRSPQQVDYIIACMDKDGICDDHLRGIVYRFFNVNLTD